MTQIAIRTGPVPMNMEMGSALRLSDDELFELCARNPELRIERSAQGDLIVMSPAGGESSYHNSHIVAKLVIWARKDGSGRHFDSSGGFVLPTGAMRAPDASWVLRSRLDELPGHVEEAVHSSVPRLRGRAAFPFRRPRGVAGEDGGVPRSRRSPRLAHRPGGAPRPRLPAGAGRGGAGPPGPGLRRPRAARLRPRPGPGLGTGLSGAEPEPPRSRSTSLIPSGRGEPQPKRLQRSPQPTPPRAPSRLRQRTWRARSGVAGVPRRSQSAAEGAPRAAPTEPRNEAKPLPRPRHEPP